MCTGSNIGKVTQQSALASFIYGRIQLCFSTYGFKEIFNMQDHIREAIGNNFGTRCLGWAGGVVSDGDLIKEIQAEAMRMGKIYRRPEWAQE